ncbi:MAG: aldehyde dehydrogenase family protein [Synechococcus sp.]
MNNFDLSTTLRQTARAQSSLSRLQGTVKNRALEAMAQALQEQADSILEANTIDLEQVRGQQQPQWILEGMKLTPERLGFAASQLNALSQLPDPIGAIDRNWNYDTGISLVRRRIPLGVIGLVTEVYPEIQIGGVGMALKSGNGIVLSGSPNLAATQAAMAELFASVAYEAGIPEGAIQAVPSDPPEGLQSLLHQERFIDLMLLCGRWNWVERMQEQSTVPTIAAQFGRGNVYIAASASWSQVQGTVLAEDSHVIRTGNLLQRFQIPVMGIVMHEAWAEQHLESLVVQLKEFGLQVIPDERVLAMLPALASLEDDGTGAAGIAPSARANESRSEASDFNAAVSGDFTAAEQQTGVPLRIVSNLDEGIAWLCKHSYGQMEGIITDCASDIERFSQSVTASSLYVNCLPNLGDPRNTLLGAFLGISTSKLHARGPISLENLTTVKYIATGSAISS